MKLTKKGWVFLAISFGIAWALCAVAWAAGVRIGSIWFTASAMAVMFSPLLSALILSAARPSGSPLKETLAVRFRVGWKGFFLSWLIFPFAAFLALGIALSFPNISYDPSMAQLIERITRGMSPEKIENARRAMTEVPLPPLLMILLQGLAAGITINAVAGFGEEAGWRGFLVKELRGSSFWGAAVFTGTVWGLWHAPIILQGHNYPQHPVAGAFMMIVWCTLISPVFLYIRLRTKSTITAAVAHGTLNATAGIAIMPLAGGSDLSTGLTGLAGFFALALILAVLRWTDKRSGRNIMSSAIGEDKGGIHDRP